jgi:hypothetical protein
LQNKPIQELRKYTILKKKQKNNEKLRRNERDGEAKI